MIERAKRWPVLAMVLSFILVAAGCGGAQDSGEEAQSFRLASFLPSNHQLTRDVVPMWMDRVEEETDGAVEIEWVGPEAVSPEDQFDAVSNGVIDIGFNVGTYYTNQVPSVSSMHLSPYTPSEEKDTEYYDYLVEKHEEAGVNYLGRWLAAAPFYFWTNERVEQLEEYQGLAVRSNPTYHSILQELGSNPVDVPPGDVYTSLERGVVQGFGFPVLGPREDGWTEVTSYIIDEPFLVQNGAILFNPESFDSLPEEAQEGIREATDQFEADMQEHFEQEEEREWEALQEAGVEPIELPQEDSEEFRQVWIDAYWEILEQEVPEEVDNLEGLIPREQLEQKFVELSEQSY